MSSPSLSDQSAQEKLFIVVKEALKDPFVLTINRELKYVVGNDKTIRLAITLLERLKTEDFILVAGSPQIGKSLVMLTFRLMHDLSFMAKYRDNPAIVHYRSMLRKNMPAISAIVRNEVRVQLKRKISTTLMYDAVYHLREVQKLCREKESRYEPKHSSEWHRLMKGIAFVDEGHMDKTTNSVIQRYIDLTRPFGTKLIFFSAEPNQFIMANPAWKDKMYIIEPSPTYYSIADMMGAKLIHQALSLTKENMIGAIMQISTQCTERFAKLDHNGYLIIRSRNSKTLSSADFVTQFVELLGSVFESPNGITVCNYNQKSAGEIDIREMINTAPKGLVIVVVQELLRAGISLNPANIIGMYDSHRTTNIGSCINSFAGRICGYDKSCHPVPVWCDMNMASLYVESYNVKFDTSRLSDLTRMKILRRVSNKSFHSTILPARDISDVSTGGASDTKRERESVATAGAVTRPSVAKKQRGH